MLEVRICGSHRSGALLCINDEDVGWYLVGLIAACC